MTTEAGGPDGDTLKKAVEGAGYDVAAMQADEAEDADSDAETEEAYLSQARKRLIIAAVPTILMVPHMFWQPIPGDVLEGESHLDESIATGESIPVYKSTGDCVIGATINKEGRLRVKATRVGGDTFLAQVVCLIDQVQGSRVPIQEFADRMTGRFVPLVLPLALCLGMHLLLHRHLGHHQRDRDE